MLKLIKDSPCAIIAILGAIVLLAGVLWQIPWGPEALMWIGGVLVFIGGCFGAARHLT